MTPTPQKPTKGRPPKFKRGDKVRMFSGHRYTIRSRYWDEEAKSWRYKLYGRGLQYEPMECALKKIPS